MWKSKKHVGASQGGPLEGGRWGATHTRHTHGKGPESEPTYTHTHTHTHNQTQYHAMTRPHTRVPPPRAKHRTAHTNVHSRSACAMRARSRSACAMACVQWRAPAPVAPSRIRSLRGASVTHGACADGIPPSYHRATRALPSRGAAANSATAVSGGCRPYMMQRQPVGNGGGQGGRARAVSEWQLAAPPRARAAAAGSHGAGGSCGERVSGSSVGLVAGWGAPRAEWSNAWAQA